MSIAWHILPALFFLIAVNGELGLEESESRARYDDYVLYKVLPKTSSNTATLKSFLQSSHSLLFLDGIPLENQTEIQVVVAPHKDYDFQKVLKVEEIKYEVLESDYEKVLQVDRSALPIDLYHTSRTVNDWLYSLANDYPNRVRVINYGLSYEQRDLLCLKISKPSKREKEAIFVEAGVNGREWIAPATALFIINELLTSRDKAITYLAQHYDWYFVPIANPDGYDYTFKVDRMWRKTRKPYGNGDYGANMNLNFNYNWGTVGVSNETCSVDYPGPRPESEEETILFRHLLHQHRNIRLYISLHAFGQKIEYPYGDANVYPPGYFTFMHLCQKAIKALQLRYGTKYTCGRMYESGFPVSGTSTDYVYVHKIAPLVFTYNLRPGVRNYATGFQLPDTEIVPTGQETLDSLVALIAEAIHLEYFTQYEGFESLRFHNVPKAVPLNTTKKPIAPADEFGHHPTIPVHVATTRKPPIHVTQPVPTTTKRRPWWPHDELK